MIKERSGTTLEKFKLRGTNHSHEMFGTASDDAIETKVGSPDIINLFYLQYWKSIHHRAPQYASDQALSLFDLGTSWNLR